MSEEFATPQVVDGLSRISAASEELKDVLCGISSGVAQVLVSQPFELIKVRIQTSATPTTAVEVVTKLLRDEGALALYKGTLAPLLGLGACVSCQFGVNEMMKRQLRAATSNTTGSLTPLQYYMCGFVSGIASAFPLTPVEHVRIRLQLQTNSLASAQYRGTVDCFAKLVKEGALMKGLGVTLMRASHGLGCFFAAYESLLGLTAKSGPQSVISGWQICGCGALAGAFYWAMIYPLDVIKSVMQSDNIHRPIHGTNVLSVANSIYTKRGFGAFFRGFWPNVFRSLPVNAATFSAFEFTRKLINS